MPPSISSSEDDTPLRVSSSLKGSSSKSRVTYAAKDKAKAKANGKKEVPVVKQIARHIARLEGREYPVKDEVDDDDDDDDENEEEVVDDHEDEVVGDHEDDDQVESEDSGDEEENTPTPVPAAKKFPARIPVTPATTVVYMGTPESDGADYGGVGNVTADGDSESDESGSNGAGNDDSDGDDSDGDDSDGDVGMQEASLKPAKGRSRPAKAAVARPEPKLAPVDEGSSSKRKRVEIETACARRPTRAAAEKAKSNMEVSTVWRD